MIWLLLPFIVILRLIRFNSQLYSIMNMYAVNKILHTFFFSCNCHTIHAIYIIHTICTIHIIHNCLTIHTIHNIQKIQNPPTILTICMVPYQSHLQLRKIFKYFCSITFKLCKGLHLFDEVCEWKGYEGDQFFWSTVLKCCRMKQCQCRNQKQSFLCFWIDVI